VGADNPRKFLYNSGITVLPSTFYTLSCVYWSSNNQVDDVYLQFSDTGWTESSTYIQPFTSQSITRNGSFVITDLGAGWKKCSGTFQTLSTTTTLTQMFFDNDVAGVEIFIAEIQLEQRDIATPYVAGTRSNTQSLLDLIGNNNTITVNSLTYNSDGSFEFNGTSDYISTPALTMSGSGAAVSAWIRIDDFTTGKTSTGRTFIRLSGQNFTSMIAFYNTGYSFETNTNSNPHEISGRTTGNVSSSSITPGAWFNFVLVFNSNMFTGYINGVQTGTGAITNNLTFDRIGDGTGFDSPYPAFFKGRITSFSFYSRALLASEVKQIFNVTRGRYGI
jgi:hypothetical protein